MEEHNTCRCVHTGRAGVNEWCDECENDVIKTSNEGISFGRMAFIPNVEFQRLGQSMPRSTEAVLAALSLGNYINIQLICFQMHFEGHIIAAWMTVCSLATFFQSRKGSVLVPCSSRSEGVGWDGGCTKCRTETLRAGAC